MLHALLLAQHICTHGHAHSPARTRAHPQEANLSLSHARTHQRLAMAEAKQAVNGVGHDHNDALQRDFAELKHMTVQLQQRNAALEAQLQVLPTPRVGAGSEASIAEVTGAAVGEWWRETVVGVCLGATLQLRAPTLIAVSCSEVRMCIRMCLRTCVVLKHSHVVWWAEERSGRRQRPD